MYGWQDGGWGWGAWVVMAVMMVLFWSAIVVAAVMLFRYLRGGYGPPPPHPPVEPVAQSPDQALRILEERFARGEIDPEDFTRRRDLIRGR